MNSSEAGLNQRILEQAVAWFVASQSQDFDEKKRARFERWLAQDAAHATAYNEAEKLWSNFDDLKTAAVPDLKAARNARPQRLSVTRTGMLALLLAVLATGWWQDYSAETLIYSAAIGQRRSIDLADGSHLEINAATHLTVRQSWLRREVELQEGEALFTVAHQHFPSFIVQAGNLQIRDIGTRFDVRKRAEATEVAVLEGEVELKQGRAWLGESLKAGYSRRLDNKGRLHPVEIAKLEQASAWAEGRMVFDHTPLAEVVAELELHHDLDFVFADPTLACETLSGNFEAADLKPFLRAVEKILPIRVQRQNQTIVLSRH